MKKNKGKLFLKILGFMFCTFLITCASLSVFFFCITKNTKLDTSKFVKASNVAVNIYDKNNNRFETDEFFSGKKYIKLEDLPSYTPKAFIATEDRRFYSHHGIDLKRMIGASAKNLKNKKFSQGASTITQQLIKNTHLSQEKTMTRKLKEIKLSLELERKLSKNEILEQYLNSIYFGNGAYGIENASRKYFNKSASKLTIGESAMLAGIIKAPSYYDPINKNQASENRKKIALSLMKNQGYITDEEYEKNANSSENIVKTISKPSNLYKKQIISEICDNLKITENQLKNLNLSITTSIDKNLSNSITDLLQSDKYHILGVNQEEASSAVLVIENKQKNILAVSGNNCSSIKTKHQPGSTIKPIIAYAPAMEYGLINPQTIIKDEPLNIDGYQPKNANKKYMGNVTVSDALQKSLNIPTVKILSNLGINKAKKFAEDLGITFSPKDQNLALALGGMTDGVPIKELADAYSSFATEGKFAKSNIIKEIRDQYGNILWIDNKNTTQAMKSSTAYLITNILLETKNNGTTRRLSHTPYEIASKTGTVGAQISNLNQEAYCVAYTPDHTIIAWFGENEQSGHLPASINGSTYPTMLVNDILNMLYSDSKPSNFKTPETVVKIAIDTRSQESNLKVETAKENTPERYKKEAYFAKDNIPSESTFDKPHQTKLKVVMNEGNKPTLYFETKAENEYTLFRHDLIVNKEEKICFTTGNNLTFKFTDNNSINSHIYNYYVIVKNIYNDKEIYQTNKIKLLSY